MLIFAFDQLLDPKMDQCSAFSAEIATKTTKTLYQLSLPTLQDTADAQNSLFAEVFSQFQDIFSAQMSVINGASLMESTHVWIVMWKAFWDSATAGSETFCRATSFVRRLLATFGQAISKTLGFVFNLVLTADIYEDEDFCPSFRQYLTDQELSADDLS